MSRIRGAVVLAVVAAFTLAGCSSTPTETPSSDSSAEAIEETYTAATGDRIVGTGYSYAVPEGWADASATAGASDADSLAADMTDVEDGFSDNVNVILSPATNVTPELVETAGVEELEGAGATDVTVRDRVTLGGEESAHLSAGLNSSGATYQIEQYYVTSDGQTYVVTFSFSPTVSVADRDAVAGSVLASWSWE